jgi:hypothetical protein
MMMIMMMHDENEKRRRGWRIALSPIISLFLVLVAMCHCCSCEKVRSIWKYVWRSYGDEFEWFFIGGGEWWWRRFREQGPVVVVE